MKSSKKSPGFLLLAWNRNENKRAMPWKGEKNPYYIWLSEIILQQTRVDQGMAYYDKFITRYPTIADLAEAPDDAVFKDWEGLGYYSRCRNLLFTARKVHHEYGGKFPDTYREILALKGVGPYTAAAIASFAFGLPHAVVDGNVLRVLARFSGNPTPIDSTEGKKFFTEMAGRLLDKEFPAEWNQAIMDFGATVCTPQNPSCFKCPLQSGCIAYATGTVAVLPVKSKKLLRRTRFLNYTAATWNDKVYIRKRTGSDIWKDLYEFALLETAQPVEDEQILQQLSIAGMEHAEWLGTTSAVKHQLTHQTLHVKLLVVRLLREPAPGNGYVAVGLNELNKYAFPIVLKRLMDAKQLFHFS